MERFRLSPLIRFTLLSLYAALVLPLPLLAPAELRLWMLVGLLVGLVLVLGLLSEQVATIGGDGSVGLETSHRLKQSLKTFAQNVEIAG